MDGKQCQISPKRREMDSFERLLIKKNTLMSLVKKPWISTIKMTLPLITG